MDNILDGRRLSVEEVASAAAEKPQLLISEEEERYHREIVSVAASIHNIRVDRHMVLLSGPSSSGKTTTAGRLKKALQDFGTAAHVVSLDDFYLGEGEAPLLPDGKPDYETIDALDVPRLLSCLEELIRDGRTELPIFDFVTHNPLPETRTLVLESDAAVIFEGIHAFNPRLQAHLPPQNTTRLFINAMSRFELAGETWLARRDLRLARRILRDDQFRGSPFAHTMSMWPQVVRGENMYLFPFADTADSVIDTAFAYEPCVLRDLLLPRLQAVPANAPDADIAAYLIERLSVFPPISPALLSPDAMLREFTG